MTGLCGRSFFGGHCSSCELRGCDIPTLALADAVEGCDYDGLSGSTLAAAVELLRSAGPAPAPGRRLRLV